MTGGGLLEKLRKVRGRDAGELRERAEQALAAWRERAGFDPDLRRVRGGRLAELLAPAVPADPAELLARLRARGGAGFFPAFADRGATLAALRARAPEHEAATLARAERLLAGRFDLLGYEGLSYGDPIDWQLDPVAGKRAPLLHWSRVPYLNLAAVGDHKVTWEVNRHQWLVTLGQAYWYSGDERYARAFAERLEEWLDANPPKLGINWASSLEVAFRAISWVWALQLFKESPALTPRLLARLLASLHLHGRHVERHLSTYFSPNTHLTGEALGLYYIGTQLPELRAAPRWRARGRAILIAQIARHLRPDGVYFEQASQYHRYSTEFYLHLLLLARAQVGDTGEAAQGAARRLLDHLLHLARPDGTIPLVGDDDGGRLVQLDDRPPHDVRALLATGAAVFGSAAYAHASRGDLGGMLWLLGAEGLRRFDRAGAAPPTGTSRAFPDGGFFVLRDGWTPEANYLLFDAGPHGVMNCGHAHADALAVEVAAAGRPVLVDAGTFAYAGEPRDAFRHAAAHNTVTVDGESSSVPGGAFAWRHVARARHTLWESGPRFDYVEGAHDGFARLAPPAEHRRAVLFVKGGYWVVRDRVLSAGAHQVDVHWHLALGLEGAVDDGAAEVRDRGAPLLRLAAFGAGAFERGEGWVSPRYGARGAAPVLRYGQRGSGAQEVITFLLPVAAGARPAVREMAASGGRAFEVAHEGGTDVLLAGEGGGVAADGVESDGELAWVRRDAEGRVTAALLVRGSRLRVNGRDVLAAAARREWLATDGDEAGAGINERGGSEAGRVDARDVGEQVTAGPPGGARAGR